MKVLFCKSLKNLIPDSVIGCGVNSEFYKISSLLSDLEKSFEGIWKNNQSFYDIFREKVRAGLSLTNNSIDSGGHLQELAREGLDCEIFSPTLSKWIRGKIIIMIRLSLIQNKITSTEDPTISSQNNNKINVNFSDFFSGQDENIIISGLLGKKIYSLNTLKSIIEGSFNSAWYTSVSRYTIFSQSFYDILISKLSNLGIDVNKQIFNEGVNYEIIDVKKNKKLYGYIFLDFVLDFIPDEIEIIKYESPLDEIRREIQQNS